MELLDEGMRASQVAKVLGVTRGAVSQWLKRLRETGTVRTVSPKSGRKPRLTIEQIQSLLHMLELGAEHWGYHGDCWTQARVCELIERKFGVRYAVNYISYILKKQGWSVQKPKLRATQRDEDAINTWKSAGWAAIKKS